ncbi:MAG: class I SAM-dependent methyltransferase [Oscillospiraceae bacterium]|nr:class I SAM-dependent methyltransferase [Oscillospiraceae bacterium]
MKMKWIYKRQFYRNFFVRIYIRLSAKVTRLLDGRRDRRICGCSLARYVPSLYRESMGATGSESSSYWSLDQIFRDFSFAQSDSFIDVGCGKGRILAYLADKKCPCPLTGIELNEDVYHYAKKWTAAFPQITLIHGNAFEQDYNPYTVMFLGRPFETEMFRRFIDYLEGNLTHPIRLIYWWDTQSGSYLENRSGWRMLRREWVFASHGLFMYPCPQRFTIWEYHPLST